MSNTTKIVLLTWIPPTIALVATLVLAFHIGRLQGEITGLRAWVADEAKMRVQAEQTARTLQRELAGADFVRCVGCCPHPDDDHEENER